MYQAPPRQTTPSSPDRDAFAHAAMVDAFRGQAPHPSADNFIDRRPVEVVALRRSRKKKAVNPFEAHLEDLARRWAGVAP